MIGIDEVGRGAWAGPLLVVAARVKANCNLPEGLTDSKLLSVKQKELLYQQLLLVCDFGEGWVEVEEIDRFGLATSLKIGAMRAIAGLDDIGSEEICIDGNINLLGIEYPNAFTRIKADLYVPIVSAASVYAKVLRDKHMTKLHFTNPDYSFDKHVGYGTSLHLEMLKLHGVTKHHRKIFRPIAELMGI